ncbi:sacsin N-terminal ATP-binding-like domain-containing protein [Bradyrhizobium sp. SZCCHNRI3052]|uniref:sacsin N-terminal ATP-binding-like domain-containing protein n=1 Tax=Bradyrhizobium sp. SZCCHNRI3052 TaxID=3057295 RepID=UPI002916B8FC|nr:hypothetical protein [Bradyrhizobium sp. SZCCHNRI3052]
MPAYFDDPRTQIIEIQRNLRDRYRTRLSIIKELIQNADDAGAHTMALKLCSGQQDTANPLLRGPALLIVNNGSFSVENERGIRTLSATSKAEDAGSAGRFGLGQKAVFHVCDAFIVAPFGYSSRFEPFIVNPFYGLEETRPQTDIWENLSEVAGHLRRYIDPMVFAGPHLALWLPLRREDIVLPAGRFDEWMFEQQDLLAEIMHKPMLATVLSAARHLQQVTIWDDGGALLSLNRQGPNLARLSPEDAGSIPNRAAFAGTVRIDERLRSFSSIFCARQALSHDIAFREIKTRQGWPQTWTLNNKLVPEKAEPHGAAFLVRHDQTESRILIHWGVFLPTGEEAQVTIPISNPGGRPIDLYLFLHGYFFVDSGRRQIEGFANSGGMSASAYAETCIEWNQMVRDRVTLPLLPSLLVDALQNGILDESELTRVVSALAHDLWFSQHRAAIASKQQLGEVWEGERLLWRALPSETGLRPLPALLLSRPETLSRLFPELISFARDRNLALVSANPGTVTCLGEKEPGWEPSEIADLLDFMSPTVFKNRALAEALHTFLDGVCPAIPGEKIGRTLCGKLRRAMSGEGTFAEADTIAGILCHVPDRLVVGLSESAASADVLRILASTGQEPLPVKQAWLQESHRSVIPDEGALATMLGALQSQMRGAQLERSARAAVELIRASGRLLSSLASSPAFRDIAVFPVAEEPGDERRILSLGDLADLSRSGLLFQRQGLTNINLKPVLTALPALKLYLTTDKDLVQAVLGPDEGKGTLDVPRAVAFVNDSMQFADASDRVGLVELLCKHWASSEQYFIAMRRLLTGAPEAGTHATVYRCQDPELAEFAENLLASDHTAYIAHGELTDRLAAFQSTAIGLQQFDALALESRLERALAVGPVPKVTARQADKLLTSSVSDGLLKRLPMHQLEDGSAVAIDETVCLVSERPIPVLLRPFMRRVRSSRDPEARKRQEHLISPHDAAAELAAALGAPNPASLTVAILDAIADLEMRDGALYESLREKLRSTGWLGVGGQSVRPDEILCLPDPISEAANAALGTTGDLAWYPQAALSKSVRDHLAFSRLTAWVLPSLTESLDKLALLIDCAALVGLPIRYEAAGAAETAKRDLEVLACADVRLPLPGWPLAAALLKAQVADHIRAEGCLTVFISAADDDSSLLAETLETLATHAEDFGRVSEAARRIYNRAFCDLALSSTVKKRAVFGQIRVPTIAGTWKPASEVARDGAGLAAECLLQGNLAEPLRRAEAELDRSTSPDAGPRRTMLDAPVPRLPSGAQELDQISAKGHREFIEHFRNRIPAELALMYLALVGRFPGMQEIANTWALDAAVMPDLLVQTIDKEIDPSLHRVSLEAELEQRRFVVVPVKDDRVEAISLAGNPFTATTVGGAELLVGNRHTIGAKHRLDDGRTLTVFSLQLRDGSGLDSHHAIASTKKLIRSISCDCLWLSSDQQMRAVDALLDRFSRTSQVLLDQTRAMLRERLPTILEPLKARPDDALGRALQEYRDAERRRLALSTSYNERQASEETLWNSITSSPAACGTLLQLVRAKLNELGYDSRRVILELFQNADDASWQADDRQNARGFRLEAFVSHLRVVHWGRPINHRGADAQFGDARGYDRDLVNMLVLNFSDKRPEDGVTGKFGLGFKCVHGLTDSVGIASGLISLRTFGGLLPHSWPEGVKEAETYHRNTTATIIDIPYAAGQGLSGREAVETFQGAAPYLPLFAKAIRHIDIQHDARPFTQRIGSDSEIWGVDGVRYVKMEGSASFSALRFDLGEGYTLVVKLDETGPLSFPDGAPRLWHVAPLDQKIGSGWLLNGPFPLTPSRAELHGDSETLFRRLGQALGEKLILVHAAAATDWGSFAAALGLAIEDATPVLFWKQLWSLFRLDLDDQIARELHAEGGGLAALAARASVVPSRLRAPFQQLTGASLTRGYLADALKDNELLGSIQNWPTVMAASGEFISEETARDLGKLGFDRLQPITMTAILQREFASVRSRVEVQHARQLGTVLSKSTIVHQPLATEYTSLRRQVSVALFKDVKGDWRPVSELTISQSGDRAEVLRSAFAPPERKLSDDYSGEALQFVELARQESGYSPRPELMQAWAERAHTKSTQVAVLRYLIEIDTGQLQRRILASPPTWLCPLDTIADGPLTIGWNRDDQNKLRAVLRNFEREPQLVTPPDDTPTQRLEPERVLDAIWSWWEQNRIEEIAKYERAVYPSAWERQKLAGWHDRQAWFTLFALAAFQNFGGTQDGQHRKFVEEGLQQGWWAELAQSRPPENPEIWLARLNSWSASTLADITHWRWRRALLDLYTIARWLPEYTRILELLPRVLERHRSVRLSDVFTPSFSPIWQQAGIDAAPLVRTLGIGVNWLLRECIRLGIYQDGAAGLAASYSWATTGRLRALVIRRLGAQLEDRPSMDASVLVSQFIKARVPDKHREYLEKDLDLPLQLVTLKRNWPALERCLALGGIQGVPGVGRWEGDDSEDDSLEAAE